jgi:hypothetical protein
MVCILERKRVCFVFQSMTASSAVGKYCLTLSNYVDYLAGFNWLWIDCFNNPVRFPDKCRQGHYFVARELQRIIDRLYKILPPIK